MGNERYIAEYFQLIVIIPSSCSHDSAVHTTPRRCVGDEEVKMPSAGEKKKCWQRLSLYHQEQVTMSLACMLYLPMLSRAVPF